MINLENMAADLAAWETEEKARAAARVTIVNPHRDVSATVTDGVWTSESAVAFARAMMIPSTEGPGHAPTKALEFLTKMATVSDRDATLSALQCEKGVMRRDRSIHRAATERATIAEGYREHKRKRRSVNNLTAAPGTSHVYRGTGS